ncbi:Uncharacterised protein [Salmonella enterica subsp. enterica serovar Bovismorbificans]|uniref:Uncharacterized protein n=1 Tax=Salmonella enterica subsp. enterica serovar Bovismorbificans TaxID=58097 RepID=A0A655BVS8_SALET|nr:Uncharacterised protein [Salmonella enterica subsp. enterica serovar Bovismorbificans]CPR61231.1 Uncharacterised protein [Salmonella enterica subsp. enterica serovar Bovismorbificans]
MDGNIANDIRTFKNVDNAGNQAGCDKGGDKRNKNIRQLTQSIAHRRFILRFRLRFGTRHSIVRLYTTCGNLHAHRINHLRSLPRPNDQLMLLPLLYVSTDARQRF